MCIRIGVSVRGSVYRSHISSPNGERVFVFLCRWLNAVLRVQQCCCYCRIQCARVQYLVAAAQRAQLVCAIYIVAAST